MPPKDTITAIYDSRYFTKGKYVADVAGRREQKRRLSWLRRAGIRKGARILDVGCATGDFLAAASPEFEVWGVDVSSYAVEEARARLPEIASRIVAADFDRLPFEADSFDAIVLWDVIEHLEHPRGAVAALVRHLAREGKIVLSTPNAGSAVARRWHFMTPPEHLGFFNRQNLESMLVAEGMALTDWMTRGKWVNLGFMLHKIARVFPEFAPKSLQEKSGMGLLAKFCVYAPTGDIQYATARRAALNGR